MGPVAIDRRASSSLADLIASMSEDELGTDAGLDAAPPRPAPLTSIASAFVTPPAGNLTAESPPTPEATVYGFMKGGGGNRCGDLIINLLLGCAPISQVLGATYCLHQRKHQLCMQTKIPRHGRSTVRTRSVTICRRSAFVSPFAATAPSATDPTEELTGVAPAAATTLVTRFISRVDLEEGTLLSAQQHPQEVLGTADNPSAAAPAADRSDGVETAEVGAEPRSRPAVRSLASPFAAPPPEDPLPHPRLTAEPPPPPPPPDAAMLAAVEHDARGGVERVLIGGLLGLPPLVSVRLSSGTNQRRLAYTRS